MAAHDTHTEYIKHNLILYNIVQDIYALESCADYFRRFVAIQLMSQMVSGSNGRVLTSGGLARPLALLPDFRVVFITCYHGPPLRLRPPFRRFPACPDDDRSANIVLTIRAEPLSVWNGVQGRIEALEMPRVVALIPSITSVHQKRIIRGAMAGRHTLSHSSGASSSPWSSLQTTHNSGASISNGWRGRSVNFSLGFARNNVVHWAAATLDITRISVMKEDGGRM